MYVYFILFLVILVAALFILKKKEGFGFDAIFIKRDNAQFRGKNLLGSISEDVHFPAQDADECMMVCKRNPECAGFGFYKPGNRCYVFESGDMIPSDQGFISGKKVEWGGPDMPWRSEAGCVAPWAESA